MSKNNVIELAGRGGGTDPLTDLLKAGAERLIYQAVEAELGELLAEYAGPPDRGPQSGCGAQWPSTRPQVTDRAGSGDRPNPQGAGEDR